eukprot:83779-Rhodomonas_salina.2
MNTPPLNCETLQRTRVQTRYRVVALDPLVRLYKCTFTIELYTGTHVYGAAAAGLHTELVGGFHFGTLSFFCVPNVGYVMNGSIHQKVLSKSSKHGTKVGVRAGHPAAVLRAACSSAREQEKSQSDYVRSTHCYPCSATGSALVFCSFPFNTVDLPIQKLKLSVFTVADVLGESCSPLAERFSVWQLNKWPLLKEFLKGIPTKGKKPEILEYEGIEVEMIKGRHPELLILNEKGRVTEKIDLLKIDGLKKSVQGVRDILEKKGFVKKPKTRNRFVPPPPPPPAKGEGTDSDLRL